MPLSSSSEAFFDINEYFSGHKPFVQMSFFRKKLKMKSVSNTFSGIINHAIAVLFDEHNIPIM